MMIQHFYAHSNGSYHESLKYSDKFYLFSCRHTSSNSFFMMVIIINNLRDASNREYDLMALIECSYMWAWIMCLETINVLFTDM